MSLNRRKREQMLAHCEELREDDGIDPREFFRTDGKRSRDIRKDRQLCAQVRDTLDLVLSGDFDDDLLRGLQVLKVEPAPNGSQLLVTVASVDAQGRVNASLILTRLMQVAGRLRCEVASAITRKRAPRLVFQVVGTTSQGEPRP